MPKIARMTADGYRLPRSRCTFRLDMRLLAARELWKLPLRFRLVEGSARRRLGPQVTGLLFGIGPTAEGLLNFVAD